jgi:hypothetical protein
MLQAKIGSEGEQDLPTGLYLHLYQGHDDPQEREKLYNAQGILVGPVTWVGSSIQGDINFRVKDLKPDPFAENPVDMRVLECNDGRFRFEGVEYNDWSIVQHTYGDKEPDWDEIQFMQEFLAAESESVDQMMERQQAIEELEEAVTMAKNAGV